MHNNDHGPYNHGIWSVDILTFHDTFYDIVLYVGSYSIILLQLTKRLCNLLCVQRLITRYEMYTVLAIKGPHYYTFINFTSQSWDPRPIGGCWHNNAHTMCMIWFCIILCSSSFPQHDALQLCILSRSSALSLATTLCTFPYSRKTSSLSQ